MESNYNGVTNWVPRTQSPVPSETSTRVSSLSSAHYIHHHGTATRLPNPPTFVEWQGMRFLIMDAPSDNNVELYLKEMKRFGVTDLVRVCDPTYAKETVEREGIRVHEMLFPDGDGPPEAVVDRWLTLVDDVFNSSDPERQTDTVSVIAQEDRVSPQNPQLPSPTSATASSPSLSVALPTIAVHCVAGLGRAPVLVGISLIEAGMRPLDAVSFLRERRRGAINNKQLRFLENYRRRRHRPGTPKCFIM